MSDLQARFGEGRFYLCHRVLPVVENGGGQHGICARLQGLYQMLRPGRPARGKLMELGLDWVEEMLEP